MSVTDKIKDSIKELKDEIKDLTHWRKHKRNMPVRRGRDNPFVSLQREINTLFDDLYGEFGISRSGWPDRIGEPGGDWPSVDVTESEKQIKVIAELPGMDEDNIDVSVTEDSLTIRGEKKTETEDTGEDYYHRECTYGTFGRSIPLPCEIDPEKVDASFKKGVLTVTLPKSEAATAKVRKVSIKPQ